MKHNLERLIILGGEISMGAALTGYVIDSPVLQKSGVYATLGLLGSLMITSLYHKYFCKV